MKIVALASALGAIMLALSACGSGGSASSLDTLPRPLRAFVHSTIAGSTTGNTVDSVTVYGPGSRAALVKAVSGDIVRERGDGYYLLVLHGHFVANGPLPPGAKPPTGTVETLVWSPQTGTADLGIPHELPPTIAKLHELAEITVP